MTRGRALSSMHGDISLIHLLSNSSGNATYGPWGLYNKKVAIRSTTIKQTHKCITLVSTKKKCVNTIVAKCVTSGQCSSCNNDNKEKGSKKSSY